MHFSSIFRLRNRLRYARIGSDNLAQDLPIAADSLRQPPAGSEPVQACPNSSEPIHAEIDVFKFDRWFLPGQCRWLEDDGPLRIWEKSRQVGATITDALDSVLKVSHARAKFDVW